MSTTSKVIARTHTHARTRTHITKKLPHTREVINWDPLYWQSFGRITVSELFSAGCYTSYTIRQSGTFLYLYIFILH